jgi:hypothetical protein
LTDAIEEARWPHLAHETEVKLLKFHVHFGLCVVVTILERADEVALY